ncbi:nucleoside hydrolase [Nocardia vaccinii]|uniref:nucleoside hydrolase n=1 Tax=Nocardia vaccinii TaxID=1822 RepID=UPI00082AF6D0|nr:nucleoside hydrolase [Nocardia vaccinii]
MAEHGLVETGSGSPTYVVVTDAFYDVDDAWALVPAARSCERLAVVTSDESQGRRALLMRHMLDLLDRPDVPVIEGIDLGGDRFLLDSELNSLPHRSFGQVDDLVGLLSDAVQDGPVVWVGQGPMGELAHVLIQAPHLAERLRVFQMGGWFDHYRRPDRAKRNLDSDQLAAGIALRLAHRPAHYANPGDGSDLEDFAADLQTRALLCFSGGYFRRASDIGSWMRGLDMLAPGLASLDQWRPPGPSVGRLEEARLMLGGVGVKR